MPEATVDEDNGAVSWQNNVGPPRQVLYMKAVSKSQGMKKTTNLHLGSSILAPYAGHHPATGFPVNDIRHLAALLLNEATSSGLCCKLPNLGRYIGKWD